MEKQKRKQTTLTLAEKVRIVEDFETNGETHEALARKYGIGSSTVTRFIQQKDELREKLVRYAEHGVTNRKTMKAQSFPLLEQVLFLWLLPQRELNVFIPIDVLRAKAEFFFGELQQRGIYADQRFAFSDGWMRRFRSRFGLQVKRGERASADLEACQRIKTGFNEKIVALKLRMCQVYSADESVLYTKMLPTNVEADKTRCTFMPCANMDGSHKLRLMFIGTVAELRCSDLPVSYYNTEKAWTTRQLFRSWFHEEFVPAVRKFSAESGIEPRALLLLDNCTAHYDGVDDLISDDGLIGVMFLPPNVTSECHPMDHTVINAIKTRYRRQLMLKLVLENEHLQFEDRLKKITLLECIDWIVEAWNEISPKTIKSSWKKLVDIFPEEDPLEIDSDSDAGVNDVRQLVTAVDNLTGTCTTERDLELWLKDRVFDADSPTWTTSEILSDDELLDLVLCSDFHPVPVECELTESSGS